MVSCQGIATMKTTWNFIVKRMLRPNISAVLFWWIFLGQTISDLSYAAASVYSRSLCNEFPFSFSTVMSDLNIEPLCSKWHGCVNSYRGPLVSTISVAGWEPYFSRVNSIRVIANVPIQINVITFRLFVVMSLKFYKIERAFFVRGTSPKCDLVHNTPDSLILWPAHCKNTTWSTTHSTYLLYLNRRTPL